MRVLVTLFLLFFSFSGEVLASPVPERYRASSAKSVVETQVESSGESQVYQSVETTVDGETIKKESNQPGKLELEMKKEDNQEPTVTFSQETTSPVAVIPTPTIKKPPVFSFVVQITDFFQNFFSQCFALVRGLTSR